MATAPNRQSALDQLAKLARLFPDTALRRPATNVVVAAAPSPVEMLDQVPLPPRTRYALERYVAQENTSGPWTVARLLAIPGFGLKTMVEIARAAAQARDADGRTLTLEEEITPLQSARPGMSAGQRTPFLQRAIALISSVAPASEREVLQLLVDAGLSSGAVKLAQIERASRFIDTPTRFAVLRRGDFVLVVPPEQLATAERIYSLAVRTVVAWGLSQVDLLVRQSGVASGGFVTAVISARPSFRWLMRDSGWFWFASREVRLLRTIEGALAVAGPMTLERLAAAVFVKRPSEHVPPLPVLATLCRQAEGLEVRDGIVELAAPGLHPRGFAFEG